MDKSNYKPLFTPRFHLTDGTLVGMEVGTIILEIVLDADALGAKEALQKCGQLFTHLPRKGIHRGILYSQPLDLPVNEISASIDVVKLKRGVIMEMRDDIRMASKGYAFIESLHAKNIEIVADDLYSKADVTAAILMGIHYGQGYFLSRNQATQKPVKTVTKNPDGGGLQRNAGFIRVYLIFLRGGHA